MAGYKAITVLQKFGDDRVEVHTRESIWDTGINTIAFFLLILLLFSFLVPVAVLVIFNILALVGTVLISLPKFCSRLRAIIIDKPAEQIIIQTYWQVGNLYLFPSKKLLAYPTDNSLRVKVYSRGSGGNYSYSLHFEQGRATIYKLPVTDSPYTLEKILNKALVNNPSDMPAAQPREDNFSFCIETTEKPDAEPAAASLSSLPVISRLNSISGKKISILERENDVTFYHNLLDIDYFFPFDSEIFWGSISIIIGVAALYSIFRLVITGILPLLFFVSLFGFIFILAAIFFITRGIYTLLDVAIACPLHHKIQFYRGSPLILLEEKFLTYTTTSKYIWEECEMSIEYAQDPQEYLKDIKELVILLGKGGQPPKRVVLAKYSDPASLIELQDFLQEYLELQNFLQEFCRGI